MSIDDATIREAARRLLKAAPGSKVILFGSHARGDARPDSDLDFLVVEPGPVQRRQEMVRLREVLRGLPVPVDVLVVSQEVFDAWRHEPNSVIAEAAREGLVFDDAA